jgi:hypothetical protein
MRHDAAFAKSKYAMWSVVWTTRVPARFLEGAEGHFFKKTGLAQNDF